jgi:hypothetical protein
MIFSEPFTPHHKTALSSLCPQSESAIGLMTRVTRHLREHGHDRGREARSPPLFHNSFNPRNFQSVAPAQTAGRRVGADAGETTVFAAVNRHDTPSLALARSWVAPAPAPFI